MNYRQVVTAGSLLLVVILGFVDYVTGDYSLVIFYLIPICLDAWYCNRWSGIGVAVCAGATRIVSDLALHGGGVMSPLHYWNFSVEAIFFLIVASLVTILRKALEKDAAG